MKYWWLWAICIAIVFGFSAGMNFLAILILGGFLLSAVMATILVVVSIVEKKFWDAFCWAIGAFLLWKLVIWLFT